MAGRESDAARFRILGCFHLAIQKYIGDPSKIVDEPLLSPIGKFVGTLVGVLGVAIFAVPAGLVGSGLIDAMNDKKRERELAELRERIRKAFLRDNNKVLSNYL